MKNLLFAILAFGFIAGIGNNALASTKVQSEIGTYLGELGLEIVPSNVKGGPQDYKASEDAVKALGKKVDAGVTIKVVSGLETSGAKVAALKSLKLRLKEEPKNPGGEFVFTVTKETITTIKGKVVTVDSDGSITIK